MEEDKNPNMNRIHYECGSRAKLIKHVPKKEVHEE